MSKSTGESMQREHARRTALVEALTIGVFLVDTRGVVEELNSRLADLLRVQPDALRGKPYRHLLAKLVGQAAEPEVVQKALADAVLGVSERPVIEVVLGPEALRTLEARFFPVWGEDGTAIGWGGLVQDVTEERQRVAWKLDLLSILSHDIRAPLATLKGSSTAILSHYRQWDDATVEEFLQVIDRNTDRLIKQVERNLALTRVESGRLGLRPEACVPGRLVEQALERAAALLDDRQVAVELSPDLPNVHADPARIEELLINLLENAARFSPTDSPIEISVASEGSRVRIAVTDHGPGVPVDRQEAIFLKHVQGDQLGGTAGLGLYISRKIAEAHGGRLWVESPLGGGAPGSRFVFTLPVAPAVSPARRTADSGAPMHLPPGQQLRVLVIEDEVDFQALLRTTLQQAGYQVELASDGPAALDLLQLSPPDLIILDWMLPGMDGLHVCSSIRRWTQAPILMVTSRTGASDLVRAFTAGVDDYLTKPFQTAELLARLHALARRRELAVAPESERLSIDGLLIDYDAQEVWHAGSRVELTPTEFKLLEFLSRHRGQVLTYQQLLEHLYDSGAGRDRHDLFVHVSRLRKKIEPDPEAPEFIQTRWGVGYVFSAR